MPASRSTASAGSICRTSILLLIALFPVGAGAQTPARVPGQAKPGGDRRPAPPADAAQVIAVPFMSGAVKPGGSPATEPWTRAACLTGFLESGGREMAAHPTWVYLCYDRATLWVAFRCEGQNGKELRREIAEADGKVWRDDSVEIKLDPSGTCSRFYHLVVNSAGQVYDALAGQSDWDARPSVQVSTDEKGWSAFLGIPFASMGGAMPRPGQAWAVNFYRNVAIRVEEATHEVPYTKVRTSWVAGQPNTERAGNYGRILFGTRGLVPVRIRQMRPITIGRNTIALDALPGLQLAVTGRTEAGQAVLEIPPAPAGQGTASFVIADDRARHLELTFRDGKGELLSRAVFPMTSPEVALRARRLPELAKVIQSQMPGFPPGARERAEKLLAETRSPLEQALRVVSAPGERTSDEWERLAGTVGQLELKLDDPACLGRTLQKLPQADVAVGLEGPMRKVMIREFTFGGWFDDHHEVTLARNEHEGFQVVVMPFERDLKNVSVSVSDLRAADGTRLAGGKVEVFLVGHVDVVDDPPYRKEISYHGWYPDPLLDFQKSCEAKAGDNVAFWIDVATGKDTAAGGYEGTITVKADGSRDVKLRLQVTVWDFVLPDGTHLRNAFTYNEPAVGRFYRERWDEAMRRKYHDFILDHRLSIDHLYRSGPPDIDLVKYGLARGMNAFNVGGEFRGAASGKHNPKVEAYYEQLKKDGLLKYAYLYGFDEVHEEKFPEMRATFGGAHQRFPGLKTMTTAVDPSFGRVTQLRSVVDIWVPTTTSYNLEEARRLRSEGRDMWWYVCLGVYHPYADFFVEYPTIESRLLTGTMSYKYEAGGFLYYLINLWDNNKKIVGPGPYTDWDPGSCPDSRGKIANGDGSLMCPGPDGPLSTMRLENIRDGFEDYEYLYRLGELAKAARRLPQTAAVKAFLARADELLVVPAGVIASVTEFSTDPGPLSDYRARLASVILEGQKLPAGR